MAIEVDVESYPVIYFRFSGETTLSDAQTMMEQQYELAKRAQRARVRLFVISDNLATTKASTEVRKYLAETSKSHSALWEESIASIVILLKSTIVRGAITAIGWVAPDLLKDVKTAKDFDGAVAIMREAAATTGDTVPERQLTSLRSRLNARAIVNG